MPRFLVQRLTRSVLVLGAVSVLAFVFMDMAPGEYFQQMRLDPQISPATLTALRAKYGLDQSFLARYANWARSVLRGDLGFSFAYNSPVWPLLKVRATNTLALTITALLCSWLIAIPIGIWAAVRFGHWEDRISRAGTTFLLSVPEVLVGLGLLALALRTRWFPTGGMHALSFAEMGPFHKVRDLALHLVLPVAALTAGMLPILVRHVRSAVLDTLDSTYIMAARSHGIPQYRLLVRHVLPVATNPLISLLGTSIGTLLSGSLLVEVVMSWPGIGPMLLEAILERDPYVVVAAVIFSTVFLAIGNLMADIALYLADPRIRVKHS